MLSINHCQGEFPPISRSCWERRQHGLNNLNHHGAAYSFKLMRNVDEVPPNLGISCPMITTQPDILIVAHSGIQAITAPVHGSLLKHAASAQDDVRIVDLSEQHHFSPFMRPKT